MKVVIDVSKHLYNNIVVLSQISLGRIPTLRNSSKNKRGVK